MRLLLAISHMEIQKYFSQDNRLEIAASAENADELFEMLSFVNADAIILSRHLKGSSSNRQIIDQIRSQRKDLRVVYLYGDKDADTENFIRYLESQGIYQYFVGDSISTEDLNRLIFGVTEKRKRFFREFIKIKSEPLRVKELDQAVITVFSNSSNGKSHFVWNLATALGDRGYMTTLINVDRGYSANLYFGIEEIYFDLLDYLITQGSHHSILENCCTKGNVRIISGKLGEEEPIETADFMKLLHFARANSDIVIIDTYTGLNETTLQAINNSNIDFMIFDSDLMHFHMNKLMLDKLGSDFIGNKTIAVINNCNAASQGYKYIYKQISKLSTGFKTVLPLSSCGSLGCDLMYTDKTPYSVGRNQRNSLYDDINGILQYIHARNDNKRGGIK